MDKVTKYKITRKTAVATAQIWFDAAKDTSKPWNERLLSMENAFNHTENELFVTREKLKNIKHNNKPDRHCPSCGQKLWNGKPVDPGICISTSPCLNENFYG